MKLEFGKIVSKAAAIIAVVFLVYLFVNSFLFTGYNEWETNETILFRNDNVWLNIIFAVIFLAVFYAAFKVLELVCKKVPFFVVVIVFAAASLAASCYWVYATKAVPISDQQFLVNSAVEIWRGNYSSLLSTGYLSIYPYQLGMVSLLRILFHFFGQNNWFAMAYLNACMVPCIIVSAVGIVASLGASLRVKVLALLLSFTCFPIYIYVTFIYGDLVSLAFCMVAVWCAILMFKKEKIWLCVPAAVFMALAMVIRINSVIVLIAIGIVAVVVSIERKNLRYPLAVLFMVAVWALLNFANQKHYEPMKEEGAEASPLILNIAMGMQDTEIGPGWNNGYNWNTFYECGRNPEKASEAAREYISQRLEYMFSHPLYMIGFYSKKIDTQWNVPMYQSLAMSPVLEEAPGRFVGSMYYGKGKWFMDEYMNIYHLAVILGSMVLCVIFFRKEDDIVKLLPAVVFIGGFLFSMLWEAKSRYVFPYFVMLIPYGAMGIEYIYRFTKKAAVGLNKKISKKD